MNRRVIGRIISISHNNVVAELYNNLGNYVTLYDGIRFVGEIARMWLLMILTGGL